MSDVIALPVLALALPPQPEVRLPAQDFLRELAEARGRDFGVADFLHEVWPDGLPATVYVANIGNDPSASSLDLLLRPACEGPKAHDHAIRGVTLCFEVYLSSGKLYVPRIDVAPHVAVRDFERRVTAPVRWRDANGVTMQDLGALLELPYHRADTFKRLEEWRGYLEWKEKLIHARRLSIPYAAWHWETDTVLGFLVRKPQRSLKDMELGAAPPGTDDEGADQRRARNRRDDFVELGEVEDDPGAHYRRDPDSWGGVEPAADHLCLRIRVEEERAEALKRRGPPKEGRLQSIIAGEIGPLRNQGSGVDRLHKSQGFSPRLADFIFSAKSAGVPSRIPELAATEHAAHLNPGQRKAVEKALAAPDLCLIQGPPGTGKTTVIADICLRAALDGKRVLVASQTNIAVDNALARIAHIPGVHPLRVGETERVDEEFRGFLAENVVSHWFAAVAGHCRDRMLSAERAEATLVERERAVERMREALAKHAAALEEGHRARSEASAARNDAGAMAAALGAARERVDDLRRRVERLGALECWALGQAPLLADAVAEQWPHAVALPRWVGDDEPPFAALDRARERRQPLAEVLRALEAAATGAASDPATAQELRALREEKAGLVDSAEEEHMRRLREVNRRIGEIKGGGWDQRTSQIHWATRAAWSPAAVPDSIREVVEATAASARTDAALAQARSLVRGEIAFCDQALEAIRASAPTWRDRLGAATRELEAGRQAVAGAAEAASDAEKRLAAASDRERQTGEAVRAVRERWDAAAREAGAEPAPPSSEAVAAVAEAARAARVAHRDRFPRAARWRKVQEEWLARLGKATDSDRERIRGIYERHSNVVGMTCNEAGRRSTWQDRSFKPYDIVIVDEVSKATPPELIMPLLLGRKAILVGDHRQLPPMFRERDASFSDAAADGEVAKEDFARFQRMVTASLFKELFEDAPDGIKAMLRIQYRMHPDIMDAVNEFYQGGTLEPGPDRERLAEARQHHLEVPAEGGGGLIEPKHHLVWIDSSWRPDGKLVEEVQRHTSKCNPIEVDVVTATLVRLGRALAQRGYGPTKAVPVARDDDGRACADILRRAMPQMPKETLDELFRERRIRVDGCARKPDDPVHAGATIEMRRQKEVGAITFYGAQLGDMRRSIDRARSKHPEAFHAMELRTNTVDRFQGMEKPIVLVSLVRATPRGLGDYVRRFERINVGISRAQQLLVIVGAGETWKRAQVSLPPLDGGDAAEVAVYRNIMDRANQRGGRRLARQAL